MIVSDTYKAQNERLEKVEKVDTGSGLWESLQQEMERLRKEEIEAPQRALQAQAWLDAQIKAQDLEKLKSLLRSKLDILVTPTQNPEEIDGLWFGVRRHYFEHYDEGYETRVLWELMLYRPCTRCGTLRPALPFGDVQVMKATRKMKFWQRVRHLRTLVVIRKSNASEGLRRLARYLYEVENGCCRRPWADKCPQCGEAKK